jgi:hypothetical protein
MVALRILLLRLEKLPAKGHLAVFSQVRSSDFPVLLIQDRLVEQIRLTITNGG